MHTKKVTMSSKTYKSSQKTKASIMEKAVEVFNEKGTAAVSMNSLAKALDISPGNLQYHYRSKKDLIRAILEEMFKEFDVIYESSEGLFTLDTLRRVMLLNFDLVWKYRFFYRENAALLRNDEILASRFREIQEIRLAEQEALLKRVAAAGRVRRVLHPDEFHNVVHMGWVLVHTWLPYAESIGQTINEAALEHAVKIMVQFYKPYIGDQS
jgi:AcrR family transcriptional regulator